MIDRKSFIKRRFGIDLESGQLPHMEMQILNAIIDQQNKDIAEFEITIAANARQIADHQRTINNNAVLMKDMHTHIRKLDLQLDDCRKELALRETPKWAIQQLWKIFKS